MVLYSYVKSMGPQYRQEPIPCDRELIFGQLKRWYGGNPHGEADEHLHLFDRPLGPWGRVLELRWYVCIYMRMY